MSAFDGFATRSGFIHFDWKGLNPHGGRLGECRFFLHPLAALDPASGQPEQRWTWACNVSECPPTLEISLVQSFTLPGPGGSRVPMSSMLRLRLVRELQIAALALGFAVVAWIDWQPGRKRPARLTVRPQA